MKNLRVAALIGLLGSSVNSFAIDLACRGTYEAFSGKKTDLDLIYVLDTSANIFALSDTHRNSPLPVGLKNFYDTDLRKSVIISTSKVEVSILDSEGFAVSKVTLDRRSGELVQKWYQNAKDGPKQRIMGFSADCEKVEDTAKANKF